MSSRQRTPTASRKDAYGLWPDSDSDRPRQTMATTQRHNVDQGAPPESSRKHRSSRRTDPLDPAAHSSHKSSSKDRSSTQPQYAVPPSPHPSTTSRTLDAYSDAYGLRAYIKKRVDKRSPRSSNEKVPVPDDAPAPRSAYPSRYDYETAATYAQPPASTNYYAIPPDQTTRDPTSSSRHHRERTKDREKSSRRDVEKLSMRDYASERSDDRERRRRKEKEAAREKERSSKDRDKHREKDRSKHRDTPAERRAPEATSIQQAYTQAPAPAQRSTDRLPTGYPDPARTQQAQTAQVAPVVTPTVLPWTGLTAGGRAPSVQVAPDAGYPSASDREDPPLPIPPPGHRRERSSSKAPRSQRHHVLAQQAAQDSGISSSEQEHSGIERTKVTDRRYVSREQASTIGRGQSSGPSGSENERAPAIQKERRKHRESTRHKSKTTGGEGPPGPTTSQEIATAWYSRHVRDVSGTKQPTTSTDSPHRPSAVVPHDPAPMQSGVPYTGKPTSHVGLNTSRPTPQIVSIRAGQGPSEPHAGTLLPKNHSATFVNRQGDPPAADRAYDMTSRSQFAAQYYQQSAGRSVDTVLQTAPHPSTNPDASRGHQHSSVNAGVTGSYQQPVQGNPNPASYSRHAELNGVPSAAGHGSQQAALPDVVVRPPSAAPTQQDAYSSRPTVGVFQHHHGVVSGQHLQASHDSRTRSTPAPTHAATQSHINSANTQQASYSQLHPSAQYPQSDLNRSATTGAGVSQQYGVADLHRILSPAPHGSTHAKGASQDPSSRFPVNEDTAGTGGLGGYGSQPAVVAYNPPAQATASRHTASAGQGYLSPSPKRNLTYPGASAPAPTPSVHVNPSNYHGPPAQDSRSPKPPSVATITQDTAATRYQGHGTHGRESSGQSAHHQPSPRYDQSAAPIAGDTQFVSASGQSAGHSPSRHHLADPGRSPAIGHAVSVGSSSGTPKHSPSGRLHASHRNGSNDTITHAAPTKPSPASTFQQQLPHRNSVTNLQSHAASRLDDASALRQPNVSSGYPEPARYRSPAPPGYPNQPQSAPNGNSANHSQSYSTQIQTTSYDQYGRPTAQSRTAQPTDYGYRAQEPPHSAPPTSTTMPVPNQRVPPRSAPSPAPTVRPPRLTAVSSPSGKAPSLHPAPPQPTRNQTHPAPAPNPPQGPFPSAHSRTVSDPQYPGRAPNLAYPSGSLPSRGQSYSKTMTNALQPPDVLLTPSSLAPSMLPAVSPQVPLDRTNSKTSTKEKDSKKMGLLGRGLSLFRSRSSPPKPREVEPPPSAAIREKRQRNVSQPTQPMAQMQASQVPVKPTSGAPAPQVAVATVSIPAPPQARRENSAPQVPVAAPTPIHGRRSPNGKMFTPFRLVAKRHHTVSTASVDAVDGTVLNAMLTGGSARSSTAGRPSPPLRDPMTAAQEWRNREEYEQQVRGKTRRRRPGVTFDVREEVPEEGRVPVQKSLKANMAAMQAAAATPAPTRQATA